VSDQLSIFDEQPPVPFFESTPSPIFDPPRSLPYQRHSDTSRAAAQSMKEPAVNLRTQVLTFIRTRGPVTDEQIALGMGINPSTARPRRIELLRDGHIVEAGKATTASGRKASMWMAVPTK
jgi:hypothetical protein